MKIARQYPPESNEHIFISKFYGYLIRTVPMVNCREKLHDMGFIWDSGEAFRCADGWVALDARGTIYLLNIDKGVSIPLPVEDSENLLTVRGREVTPTELELLTLFGGR
jgi:hypothetical protein